MSDLVPSLRGRQRRSRAWSSWFVAQRSDEKALKAFLYDRGQGTVLGHSTTALATCHRSDVSARERGPPLTVPSGGRRSA
jgi:hypothetical protein